jgi:hypothetical protein
MPLDYEKINFAIENSKTLTLTTYTYLANERKYVDDLLLEYLKSVGQEHLHPQISYCIHELAGNANKANTKRVYFDERSLNIHDQEEYETGMQDFKKDTIDKAEYYYVAQKGAGLYIKFHFRKDDEKLTVFIRNNVQLTRFERARIEEKFEAANQFNNIAEAYSLISDQTEGAGLGIVMMILMLRTLGFEENPLRIYCRDGETIAKVTLNTETMNTERLVQTETYAES